jgi:hypothetical protein
MPFNGLGANGDWWDLRTYYNAALYAATGYDPQIAATKASQAASEAKNEALTNKNATANVLAQAKATGDAAAIAKAQADDNAAMQYVTDITAKQDQLEKDLANPGVIASLLGVNTASNQAVTPQSGGIFGDYSSLIMVGIVAIGGIWLLSKVAEPAAQAYFKQKR